MEDCPKCKEKFEISKGINVPEVSSEYPVRATADYCPFCGHKLDDPVIDIRRKARIKNNWNPKPPDVECVCGKKASKMVAVDTGDGWYLSWECTNDCGELGEYEVGEWPFIEEFANVYDLEAAGFTVV